MSWCCPPMTDEPALVSRETPPVPSAARGVFRDRLGLAEQYAAMLSEAGVVRGLIGPREVPRLWDRHLLNCAVLGELLPVHSAVADLGSGAGLPGMVLAVARPDLQVTLIEPMARRAAFLQEVAQVLSLDRVLVVRGRAEDLVGEVTVPVVTARAVAPLDRLARWALPLLTSDGRLLAVKGSSAPDEISAHR